MYRSNFIIRSTLILIVLVSLSAWSKSKIITLQSAQFSNEPVTSRVPIYLPQIDAVKITTLGYKHFVATIFWFRTLHYFGAKFEAKENMPWFSHMCELVTELDPQGRHVFESCATLMAWIAREPKKSVFLLTKGISHDNKYWRYYYLRGFMYWYFLEEFQTAREDFEYASTLKEAPVFLASLASRLMSYENDFDAAIAFLQSSSKQSEDPQVKEALEERLDLAYVSRDIHFIERAIRQYELENKKAPQSLNDLSEGGFIKYIPKDPYGDAYIYDSGTESIRSIQGGAGLKFHGKTAKTGIASKEGWVSNED